MRFLPHSPAEIERALEVIGLPSTDALFASIPAPLRERATLNLPAGLGEQEVMARLSALAAQNRVLPTFQGAGCYRHYVPAAVQQILSRPEFSTAYTPYQPEVSQGTLQACFEFQTYVAQLTGLEVANASVYDGASALAEAVLMALRLKPRRDRVLLSEGIHPQYREVVATYLRGFGRGRIESFPLAEDGRSDLDELSRRIDDDVATVCLGYPNFFGVVEDVRAAATIASSAETLLVTATTEALALALLESPGRLGADIAVAEGQSFGLAPSYGGPGVGLFATRRRYVRQMPGRLVGETVDQHGRRGFVLTLATREQHIRREKATSNICTNQGLAALAATVYLSLAGRSGLRRLAWRNTERAHEVAERLHRKSGLARIHSAPFFNEFAVAEPESSGWFEAALEAGVVPGVRVPIPGDSRRSCLLIAVTECVTESDTDKLVATLQGKEAA